MRTLFGGAVRLFRQTWQRLFLIDILYKVIAFVLLTPLLGVVFRTIIATSGSAALSDADILSLFLGPVGWICFILVGAIGLGIVALEQASLLGILYAKTLDKNLKPIAAFQFARAHAWPVVQVTIRIVTLVLLAITPFLAIAAAVYFSLLTVYDINYYLKEKPVPFRIAIGVGALLVAALTVLLLRLCTS
jgi:glycerophosphoryl diester phosphodiesterase